MILNYKDLKSDNIILLKCGKILSNYFIYNCKLPIYSVDENYFLFLYTRKLKNIIDKMDLYHKIILNNEGFWKEIKDKPPIE